MNKATLTTQKLLTTQTRRHAMQAKKLTLVGLLVIAAIIGGCSNQNSVTGPEMNPELSATQPEENNQPLTKATQSAMPRRSFDAVMHRVDIEGGCWYLETEKGEKFEPYFENGESIRYEGMEIHVYGYEDRRIATICMIAPVFRIEKHEILSKGDDGKKTPELNNSATSQVSTDDKKHIAVTGIMSQEDYPEGCIYLKTDREGAFELEFRSESAVPELSKGSIKATVAGWLNPKKQSKCIDGWVLEVDKLQVLDSGKEANHAEASSQATKPVALKPQASNTKPGPMLKLQGRYGTTEAGCMYLKNDKGAVELFFVPGVCPNIKVGSLIEVTGVYSLLTVSFCELGPRFNVYSFEVLESKTQEESNSDIAWRPIHNRYTQKAENHRADF